MRLGELAGYQQLAGLLQKSLQNGRIVNAYLFVGAAGAGKTTAAQAFARALLCPSPQVQPDQNVYDACGQCATCLLTAAGNHPHLRTIAPDGERIKIEQMRDLRHDVALTAFGGARRVYIIRNAEAMTEESANCILKTLEEPPPDVTLILTSESLAQLLPTIISRCQVLRFRPVPLATIEQLLLERLEVPPHHARFIANVSAGRPGWAMYAAQHPTILQVRERLLHLLGRIPEAEPVLAFRAAEELRALAREMNAETSTPADNPTGEINTQASSGEDRQIRAQADTLLDMARTWFRDLLVLKLAQGQSLINGDCRVELGNIAARYSIPRLQDSLDALARARRILARNANVTLSLEVMMARLLAHGEGCAQ